MDAKMIFEHNNDNSDMIIEDFLMKLLEEQDFRTKAVSLYSFIKKYLQSSKEDSIEFRRISTLKIILKVPEVFAALTHFKNSASYNDGKEIKVLNLQGATLCLDTLLMYDECFKSSEQLQLLLQITLEILYQAYSHCKDSETLYGDLLEDFTDQLAGFYQKIQDIQTVMMLGFDHLLTVNLSNVEDTVIISMSDDLGKLCNLVSSLDAMIAVKLWRIYVKVISHFSSIVHDKLEAASILSSLTATIRDIIYEFKFKINNNEKIEDSDIKIFLFQINLVMKIVHVFHGCLDNSLQNMNTLASEFCNLLIASYSSLEAEDGNQQTLKSALMNSFSPMMSLFHSENSFLTCILDIHLSENASDFHLPHLLLKLTALIYLNADGANYLYSDKRTTIIKQFFNILQKNNLEDDMKLVSLKFPRVLFYGLKNTQENNEQFTTLYKEYYNNFCEFCKLISDSDFCNLVIDMTAWLNSSSEIMSLLISDVWMYRLRCSSIEYLYCSCLKLSSIVLSIDSSIYQKLHFKRMLKFLPSDKKLKLFAHCEDKTNLLYYTQKTVHRYGIPQLSTSQNEASYNVKEIYLLMDEIKRRTSKDDQSVIKKACNILELFSMVLDIFQNCEILKFVELASFLFQTEIYEIQIAVLTFLKTFRRKCLTESPDLKKTINCLGALLIEVLRSTNYIVRQEAFMTYTTLARTTHHPEILKASVALAPELVPVIKSYIMKEPLSGVLTEKERLNISIKQLQTPTTSPKPERKLSEKCKTIVSCLDQLFYD